MRKYFWLFASLVYLSFLHCAPPKEIGTPPKKEEMKKSIIDCPPQRLSVRPADRKLILKWDTTCPDSILLSGYNIYILPKPLPEKYLGMKLPDDIVPFNNTPYPGDTDPEDSFETMTIENLDNGDEYFLTVRTVYPDGHISSASSEASAICRPEGTFTLAFRYADLNDGFSFSQGKSVRADASDNDLYFFEKDGINFIASPHRLNGFLRHSGLYSLGKTEDIYQYPKVEIDFPPVEKIPALLGESYIIKTANAHYAKIRIEEISGKGKERKLKINYTYQTVKDLIRF
jgi:hypothetical protein